MGYHPDQFVKNLKTGVVFNIDFHNRKLPFLSEDGFIHAYDHPSYQNKIEQIKKNNIISFILADGDDRNQAVISDNIIAFDLDIFEEYYNNGEYDLEAVLSNYSGKKYTAIRDDGFVFEIWDHNFLDIDKLKEMGFSVSEKNIESNKNPNLYLFVKKDFAAFYHFFSSKGFSPNEIDIYKELNLNFKSDFDIYKYFYQS